MSQISRHYVADEQLRTTADSSLPLQTLRRSSALALVMVIAVILRIASALYQGNDVQILPGTFDQISYDLLARRLLSGNGFTFAQDHWPITRAGEPTAHWSYLYTIYLTLLYATTGINPLLARLVQAAVAGILHCWFAWRIGRRIGGPQVGLTAAILSAGYIYFFYYAGALMTETFYILGILWTLDCAMRLAASPMPAGRGATPGRSRQWLWLELGLALSVTILLRQVFLLFVPFLFVWVWWNHLREARSTQSDLYMQMRTTLIGSFLAVLVICLAIAPWTIRNYRAFHTFVPLNTNSGYAFFWGNHPIYGTNFVGILPDEGPSYQELIPPELRHLNEAELDQALLKEGLRFVVDDPLRYALLSVSRIREYFKFWPSPESGLLSNISRVGSFGLLLPFIGYGLAFSLVLAWRTRNAQQRAVILLLVLFSLVYTGVHLLTWALIRYRLPVDAIFMLFAAVGIVDLSVRVRRDRQSDSFLTLE